MSGDSKSVAKEIRDLIDKDLNDIEVVKNELSFKKFSNVLFSFYVVLILSIFVVAIGSISLTLWNLLFLLFPISAIIICYYYWDKAKKDLTKELKNYDSSESEITRIIDKYSGIIDGIGTALPLVGAAFLLGVVSANIPDQGTKDFWFIKIAIPIEILSILMLAAAKLFEPAFDQLAVIFQNIIDHVKREETRLYHEETLKVFGSQANAGTNVLPDAINKVDDAKLKSIETLLGNIDKSVAGLGNANVASSLQCLSDMILQNNKNNP
ncbi:MAG: hypothetical protein IPG02_02390 [Ignavibacteria bacterium]|nr:hypothetical protein [Ignavibacteria bacterium]